MKVSFFQKKTKKVNESSLSIKFGDCSAVAGVLSDKSLFDDLNQGPNNDHTLEDHIYALDERSSEDQLSINFEDSEKKSFPDVSAIQSDKFM